MGGGVAKWLDLISGGRGKGNDTFDEVPDLGEGCHEFVAKRWLKKQYLNCCHSQDLNDWSQPSAGMISGYNCCKNQMYKFQCTYDQPKRTKTNQD